MAEAGDRSEDASETRVADASDNLPNQLERKIIRQVEFYFGDRNLPRDKFLQEKIKEDEGWVEMTVLLTFNRLKSLSTDQQLIAAALRKSANGIVEVNTAGTKVRRSPELPSPVIGLLPPEVRKEMKERTLYVKGFPTDCTLDQIEEVLLEYGETELISMKKNLDGQFRGSVFVEFKAKESVDKVLAVEKLCWKDSLLSVETKEDYLKRKNIEKKEKTQSEEAIANPTPKPQEKLPVVRKSGTVLHFAGVSNNTMREPIKEHFRQYATVAFVDFSKGDTEGYVRFDEEGGAKKAVEEMEKMKSKLCGVEAQLRVLEGEEEKSYWSMLATQAQSRGKKKKQGMGRGSRKHGAGKRGLKNGERDAPLEKRVKTESNNNAPLENLVKTESNDNS